MLSKWTTKELKNKSDDEIVVAMLAEKMSRLRSDSPLHKRLQKIAKAIDGKITDKQEGETTLAIPMPRVIVRIEGGNFQGASGNMFVDLSILDIDNMEACDPVRNKWELDYYRRLEREVTSLFPIH
jgi:hypothetical protein